MRLSWPLTGRSEELLAIEATISDSDVFGIVVGGAAGVGKSRIVREALSAAVARGCEGRWAVGTSSARTLPLGAFNVWSQPDVTDTIRLVRGVIESLTAAPEGATVVVAVDDVHLLDDLSIFVVQQIVQRGAAKVVLTVRSGDPIPTAVQEIWRGGQFDRLELQPLSQNESATLLSATLGSVDPDAAQRLWTLTHGNALYLRNVVERELADGRLEVQEGAWRWTGDPIVAPGLVEVIESRIGTLPTAVGEVIDALAVGEPIQLAALRRITSPAAVEDADTRGLILLEPAVGGLEVRVAHPLYGEVRRERTAPTRLRRLRGLVATELAASEHRDDVQVLVRRATLSLESDLTPDADLLVRAANGAVWLADLPLADRLAEAAIRAGAGSEANFVRAHALSWLSRGEEADAVLAEVRTSELTDDDTARFAFLRASNMLWVLADPVRAKELIDDAARTTPQRARSYIDAFLTVYWFAMDQPALATLASEHLALDELPAVVDAELAWALTAIYADAGRTTDAVAVAEGGYTGATRSLDAPQMRFNIADAHVSALLLAGRIQDAVAVAERAREQAADLPGAAHLLGGAVAGRAALGAGRLDTACALLEQAAAMLSASGHALGWGYRYHFPLSTALAIRGFPNDGGRRTVRARSAATSVSVAGLRTEPRPRLGVGWPGCRQRSDHDHAVGGRNGAIPRGIRCRGVVPTDRHTVRRPFGCASSARARGDRRGTTRRSCPPVRRGPPRRRRSGIGRGVRGLRAHGRPRRGRGCGRARGRRLPPPRAARVGIGMLDARRRARRTMRRRRHPCTSRGQRRPTADRSRARDRHADRRRTVEPRHRRASDPVGPHRRQSRLPRHAENRDHQPRRTRQVVAQALAGIAAARRRDHRCRRLGRTLTRTLEIAVVSY